MPGTFLRPRISQASVFHVKVVKKSLHLRYHNESATVDSAKFSIGSFFLGDIAPTRKDFPAVHALQVSNRHQQFLSFSAANFQSTPRQPPGTCLISTIGPSQAIAQSASVVLFESHRQKLATDSKIDSPSKWNQTSPCHQ
eukprot:scaffold18703_cov54-Cylindrotheca_fusiformis.AAC.1